MAPQAIFKAWRPMFNEDTSTIMYGYDEQLVSVNLEDRTLVSLRFMSSVVSRKIFQIYFFFLEFQVILELNTTEVSHSSSTVGIEVFAEPESTICLRGQRTEAASTSPTSVSNTFGAVLLSSPMYQDVSSKHMIRVFAPVSKTWFFQCGQAR